MTLYIHENPLILWHNVLKNAEDRCSVTLDDDLETYLISLLIRYSNKPEVAQQIFAKAYLEAMQQHNKQRQVSLQHVGDLCLLYAGLFPQQAEKRQVKITYFVDLGRSAYAGVSQTTNDLFWELALEFVTLMDILQSIRVTSTLLPLEAYEQWESLGSKRALRILQSYTDSLPFKK